MDIPAAQPISYSTARQSALTVPRSKLESSLVRRYLSSCRENCPDGDISECWLMVVYLRFRNLLRADLEGVGQSKECTNAAVLPEENEAHSRTTWNLGSYGPSSLSFGCQRVNVEDIVIDTRRYSDCCELSEDQSNASNDMHESSITYTSFSVDKVSRICWGKTHRQYGKRSTQFLCCLFYPKVQANTHERQRRSKRRGASL